MVRSHSVSVIAKWNEVTPEPELLLIVPSLRTHIKFRFRILDAEYCNPTVCGVESPFAR